MTIARRAMITIIAVDALLQGCQKDSSPPPQRTELPDVAIRRTEDWSRQRIDHIFSLTDPSGRSSRNIEFDGDKLSLRINDIFIHPVGQDSFDPTKKEVIPTYELVLCAELTNRDDAPVVFDRINATLAAHTVNETETVQIVLIPENEDALRAFYAMGTAEPAMETTKGKSIELKRGEAWRFVLMSPYGASFARWSQAEYYNPTTWQPGTTERPYYTLSLTLFQHDSHVFEAHNITIPMWVAEE